MTVLFEVKGMLMQRPLLFCERVNNAREAIAVAQKRWSSKQFSVRITSGGKNVASIPRDAKDE